MYDNPLQIASLAYAARGWRVFPIHSVHNGVCSCGHADCKSPGKHPRTRHGVKDASIDKGTIEKWWRKWPTANVGVATGSGLIVIDIDGAGGMATLRALLRGHTLPRAPAVRTSRGLHLYFAMPAGRTVSCGSSGGLDIRGEGGYVVAPPSIHASGHVYVWI